MIHLITSANRHLYGGVLDTLFSDRFRYFVEERGWDLSYVDGRERDVYDDELAHYLVALTPGGDIAASCRVRPTLTGGVLPDLFPHLIAPEEPPLTAPGVFECTRYFSAAHLRGRAGFAARSRLHIALLELMGELKATRLLGFVDLPMLAHLRRYSGLRLRPVGEPHPYAEGGVTVAFELGVAADDLALARARLALPGRQLLQAPAWLPPSVNPQILGCALDVWSDGASGRAARLSSFVQTLSRRLSPPAACEAAFERLRAEAA